MQPLKRAGKINTDTEGNTTPKSYLLSKCLLNDMLLSNRYVLQKLFLLKVMVQSLCASCYKRAHCIHWATANPSEVSFIHYPHFKDTKWRQRS